jgi:site-specific recombinase XerD
LPATIRKQANTFAEGRENIRLLLKQVHKRLNVFVVRGLEREAAKNERRDLVNQLRMDIRSYDSLVPPNFYIACTWAIALFKRTYSGRKKLLAVSSIRRYFDAIASKFAALASAKDLRLMNEDEIAGFYMDVLSIRSKEKSIYVYRRIKDFHKFAQKQYQVKSVDWGKVAFDTAEELCSPGYIEEGLYQKILKHIDADEMLSFRERTCTLALTFFAYRFGLREDEAFGMFRDDWVDQKDYRFVIVRRSTLRGLKTTAARRQVPLAFNLSPLEQKLLVNLRDQWKELSKGSKDAPLFCDPSKPDLTIDANPIYDYLNRTIQLVSGSKHLSIHKLRHSFAARIWDALQTHEALSSAHWRLNTSEDRLRIRKLLLGSRDMQGATRRAQWVLAAAMGHAHPRHAAFSYVHIQSDCAEILAYRSPKTDWQPLDHGCGTNLDAFNPYVRPTNEVVVTSRSINLVDVLNAAGMLSDDIPLIAVAESLKLPDDFVRSVDFIFLEVSKRLSEPIRAARKVERKPEASDDFVKNIGAIDARKKTRVKSGSTGLLSHILAKDRATLVQLLSDLQSTANQLKIAAEKIPADCFCAMFGQRRLISLWTSSQFELMRDVLIGLGVNSRSIQIAAPLNVSSKVRLLAEEFGFVKSDKYPANSLSVLPNFNLKLDRVQYGDPAISVIDRFSVSLIEDSHLKVKNRYQLILILVCIYSWANWNQISDALEQA